MTHWLVSCLRAVLRLGAMSLPNLPADGMDGAPQSSYVPPLGPQGPALYMLYEDLATVGGFNSTAALIKTMQPSALLSPAPTPYCASKMRGPPR